MLHFIAAIIPLYFVYAVVKQLFTAEDGAEFTGTLLGIVLFVWVISLLLG
jgi:hypothetical protein